MLAGVALPNRIGDIYVQRYLRIWLIGNSLPVPFLIDPYSDWYRRTNFHR
jgi:hypothetical protein